METISIYLSGGIKKGKDDKEENQYWTDEDEKYITGYFTDYEVEILNPAKANIRRSNPRENFGADLYLVKKCDILIADLRERRGIGVGSEMTVAKYFRKPVLSICPKESYYRRSKVEDVCGENLYNWAHPFVVGLSDKIAEDLKEALYWINDYLRKPKYIKNLEESVGNPKDKSQKTLDFWIERIWIKDFGIIEESMRLYTKKQLEMRNMLELEINDET